MKILNQSRLKMPKNNRKKVIELSGESQHRNMAKCMYEDDIRSFRNLRTFQLWKRIHDSRCSCLKEVTETKIAPSNVDEIRNGGFDGNQSRKQKDFLDSMGLTK